MASYGNYGQTISGTNGFPAGYGGYTTYPSAGAVATAPIGYSSQPIAYGSLAGYGVPRAAPYYNQASYSTSSLSGDALAYAPASGYAPAASYQARQSQYSGPVLSGLPAASSYGGVSGGIEQYGANLAPQIEAAYEAAALHRRQPVIRRQVIQVPGNPGQVRQIVRRVPTPIPDVIERVFVVKPQRDVVNLVIERPTTPPPQVKNRTIVAKARKPVINSQVVRVAPRSIQQAPAQVQPVQVQQTQVQYAPAPVQYAPAPVQVISQPAATNYSYDYGTGYSYTSSFDTITGGGAAYQQQQYGGYSTGYPANYGLPAYAGASSYTQQPYNYSYAQPSAYPVGYATASNAYSSAYIPQQSGSAAAYPSIIAANQAGNAYYGYGYPAAAQYGYAPRY